MHLLLHPGFGFPVQTLRVLRRRRNRREIRVQYAQVFDRFLELQVGLPAYVQVAIKQLPIHLAVLEQLERAAAERLGFGEHLSIAFQGERPAGFYFFAG